MSHCVHPCTCIDSGATSESSKYFHSVLLTLNKYPLTEQGIDKITDTDMCIDDEVGINSHLSVYNEYCESCEVRLSTTITMS